MRLGAKLVPPEALALMSDWLAEGGEHWTVPAVRATEVAGVTGATVEG